MAKERTEARREYNSYYRKKEMETRKRLGICIFCGKEDAFLPFVACPACLEKQAQRASQYRKKVKADSQLKAIFLEKKRNDARKRYRQNQENGLCSKCGKRRPDIGKKSCVVCLEKDRLYRREYDARKRRKEDV